MLAPIAARAVWTFDAIGTRWSIETGAPLSPSIVDEVEAVVARFDRSWSRFRDDSVVAGLAREGGDVPAPDDAVVMLDAYVELDAATAGAVNPLVGDRSEEHTSELQS